MNCVVTGGAGFIGSHLCDRLMADGAEVTVVDNFFTGAKRNIGHLLDHPAFELVRHDITVPLLIETDRIFHLACPASPVHYQEDPVKTVETNVVGTDNMLKIAQRTKARILLASTSEVYGNPDARHHPQREDYWGNVNPIGPRSCYDEGKRVAETLMFDYHRERKVDIRVVRIFNTYGPRMSRDDGRVVSNFIVSALKHEPITVFGKGDQTRSFCFVADLVDGLVRMMDKPGTAFTGPVNLGNPDERTILELAEIIIRLTKSRSRICHKGLPTDDPERRKPVIALAKKALGWKPVTPLEEGLERTIAYFREIA